MKLSGDRIDPHFLLTKVAPYSRITSDQYSKVVANFMGAAANFDAYCVDCKQAATFAAAETREHHIARTMMPSPSRVGGSLPPQPRYGILMRQYNCTRISEHIVTVVLQYTAEGIMKIGQFPSMADLADLNRRRYETELGDSTIAKEFVDSSILFGHGYGIAAFLYVRRVIEHIVKAAEAEAAADGIDLGYEPRATFFRDRIKALAGYLPDSMVQNARVYSLLSEGVHNLTDDLCLKFFPAMQSAVAQYMQEHQARRERKRADKTNKEEIAKIAALMHLEKAGGDDARDDGVN